MAHLKGIQVFLCFIKALACWLIYFWCLVVGIVCMTYFWYKDKNSKLTVVLKKCIKLTVKIYIDCKEKEENKFFRNLLLVGTFKIFFHYLWGVGRLPSNGWHLLSSLLPFWLIPSPDFQGRNYHTPLKGFSIHGYSCSS